MATKTFNVPSNVTQVSSNFSKNSSGYYTGQARFRAATNYEFETPTLNSSNNYTNYNVLVTRTDGTTFNIKYKNYCTFAKQSDGDLIFYLLAGAQLADANFALPFTFQPTLNQIATPTEITVTQSLSNCVLSGLPSNVYDDTTLNLTITPNSNYEFTTAPKIVYLDENSGDYETINFAVNQNGTASLTIDLSTISISNAEITITANATVIYTPTELTVTQNLSNCVLSGLPSNVYENSTLNLTVTATTDYSFNAAPALFFSVAVIDNEGDTITAVNFTVSNNNKTATLTINLSDYQLDYTGNYPTLTITATANADEPVYNEVDVNTSLTNCEISGLPNTVYENSVLNLTITADANSEFDDVPRIVLLDAQGNPQVIYFTLSNNNTVANVTIDLSVYSPNTLTIYATANVITPYTEKYGNINVYKLTENQLKQFSTKRFFVENIAAQTDTPQYVQIDLGEYVHSLKRIYCNVETQNDVIHCGNYNTEISATSVLTDNVTIDCGSIIIPYINNSSVDYNCEITLFLPFVGFVTLPSDYLNKELNLQYVVNVITTNAIVNIIYNNNIVIQYECNVANDLVFTTPQKQGALNSFNNAEFNMNVLKGLQPYALLKYYVDENKALYNSDNIRQNLQECNGFNVITELSNFENSDITQNEYANLVAMLEQGVFF